ncbi:MAG: helix-turn-helix transcriptional regulator [Bacteroides sp.]|nr:helix-turn-helix transcriptional regulator [Bacteroides sp.]
MNRNFNIAVIGLSVLETIGIRSLIHEEFNAKVERYGSFTDYHVMADEAEGYVVSSDVFSANIDFFLPRKQKTVLIVTDALFVNSSSSGLSIVSCNSDEANIKKVLISVFKNIEDGSPQHDSLSGRETEVLKLIASGKINKEIADILCISVNTVITHRKNISAKLGIKSASGMSLYAMMNGII